MDQFGGGRTDPHATASARLWYAANVAAAGLPMRFMGTEFAQVQAGGGERQEWAGGLLGRGGGLGGGNGESGV